MRPTGCIRTTGTALLPVVRATWMPSARAASRSRLSVPTPHLCSSRSFGAARSRSPETPTWPAMAKSAAGDHPPHLRLATRLRVVEREARRQQGPQTLGGGRCDGVEHDDRPRHSEKRTARARQAAGDADGGAVGAPAGGAGEGAAAGDQPSPLVPPATRRDPLDRLVAAATVRRRRRASSGTARASSFQRAALASTARGASTACCRRHAVVDQVEHHLHGRAGKMRRRAGQAEGAPQPARRAAPAWAPWR